MSALSLWDDFEIPPQARRGRVTLNLYDQLSAYASKRPGAYLWFSSARFGRDAGFEAEAAGLEAGVDRQHEDAEDTRGRLRWDPPPRSTRRTTPPPHTRPGQRPAGVFTSSSARSWGTSMNLGVWHFGATLPPRVRQVLPAGTSQGPVVARAPLAQCLSR